MALAATIRIPTQKSRGAAAGLGANICFCLVSDPSQRQWQSKAKPSRSDPIRDGAPAPDGVADLAGGDGGGDGVESSVANSKTQVQQEAQTSGGHFETTEKRVLEFWKYVFL